MRVVDFTKYIVEGLLGEESKKKIATFAGSFRPPTKSDYNLLLKAIDDNPGLDEIHVFVGDAESEGLDQDDAVRIWQMFGEHFPRNFYVHKSEQSPISDVYAYANKFPTYDIDWLFGVREGNSDDFKQIADRTKSVNKYDNLSISPVVYDNKATEREVAAAANMGKDELAKYMPSNLTYKELDDVYNMLQPNELTEITSTHTSEWDDLLRKLTEEGYEFIPDLQPWEVVIKSNELKKPIFSYSRQFTSNKDFENKSLKVFLSEPESDDFERVNLRHANEEDIEYLKQAGSLGEQMKKLDEALNKYPYDIINKVAEEGWEYYETTASDYHAKEEKVNSVARQEKKKYFTLDADIKAQKENSFVTIFWSDKGDGSSRDVILGGTMQDYEDIVNAAKSNLNEALIKYSDDIINKIAEEGWEYYETTAQTGSADKAKVIYSKARKDKKRYFTLNQNDSLLNILWADGKKDTGIFSRDALEGGTEQDMQDIIDTGLSNLNEVATEDLEKFDQVIGKIVDGDFKFFPLEDLSFAIGTDLQRNAAKLKKNLFTIMLGGAGQSGLGAYHGKSQNVSGDGIRDLDSKKKYTTQVFLATPDNKEVKKYFIRNTTKEDYEDIINAAKSNLNEVATEDLEKFDQVIGKIVDGDFKQYNRGQRSTAHRQDLINDMIAAAKEAGVPGYFSLSSFPQGRTQIHFSTGETFLLDDLRPEDIKDIEAAADINLNEVATADLRKFEDLLNKISKDSYEYYPAEKISSFTDTGLKLYIKEELASLSEEMGKNFFTVIKNTTGGGPFSFNKEEQTSLEVYLVKTGDSPKDVERFFIHNTTEQDVDDLLTVAGVNLEDLTEARNVPRFGKMLNKIAEGDYYHVPAEDLQDIGRLEMRQVRYDYKYDIDKPMFSYSIQKTPNELKDIIARFSDDPEDTFWIIDSTEQDRQDLKDVVDQFTTLIPSKLFKEGAEFNLNESKQVGTEFDIYEQIIDFMSQNGMKLDPRPTINIIDNDRENAEQFFGKTAYYDPSNNIVVLYTLGRHPKDVARSFAHELVHCHQNHEGRLEGITTTNTNEDDHLEEIEREAYETGNIMFRKWSDSVKGGAIQESVKDNKIICDNCGWNWNIADGGDDMFTCHKCGSDNNQPIVKESLEDVSIDYIKNSIPKLDSYPKSDIIHSNRDLTYVKIPQDKNNPYAMTYEIKVFDINDGTLVAQSSFDYDKNNKLKGTLDVRPDKRRKGIATEIYTLAEKEIGDTIYPEEGHTEKADKFWNQKNRSFGPKDIKEKKTIGKKEFSHELSMLREKRYKDLTEDLLGEIIKKNK